MKWLALYTLIALVVFAAGSVYFAVVGDNAPLFIIICIACLPGIAFSALFLGKKR